MKTILKIVTIAVVGTGFGYGQTTPDSSGNSLLKGAYRFRQVAVTDTNTNGNPSEITASFGVITFNGAGSYTINGTFVDNTISSGAQQTYPANSTGSYAIGANGIGLISSPINSIFSTSNLITGTVAQGVFAGSDTLDGDVSDIFIAIPVSTPPTNASFKTAYSVGLLDFTGASDAALKNALFNLTPNGAGGLGTITLSGQAANQVSPTISQTVTGATYNFGTDGNANLIIPPPSGVTTPNALFVNNKSMYVSADGNFVLGWTAGGYDIFFGVSTLTGPASNSTYAAGTYFTSALEDVPTGEGVDNYYGSNLSFTSAGSPAEIAHQYLEFPGFYAEDVVFDNYTQINTNGTASDTAGYQYVFGDAGKAFVATGSGGFYSLLVGTQAPPYSGSGVFLDPVGIFNSASYAPITASVAPGELLTLFGSGLAQTSQSAVGGQPFQNSLGGVQVLMNNTPAPIFYVSSGQIATVVPYELSPSSSLYYVTIQINNNGQLSNTVTLNLTDALPGIYTQSETGIGFASVLHNANYTLVTPQSPAVAGEYIDIFLTGLGTVSPVVGDGAIGPTSPLSYADVFNSMNLTVSFDDYNLSTYAPIAGTIAFAGLAPGYAGLYQISVQVPSGLGAGDDVYLEIQTDFADVNQVYIPMAGSSGAARPEARHGSPLVQSRKPRGARRSATSHAPPSFRASGLLFPSSK